ncbi:PRC-barrel domain-containing protein [Rhizobium sp. RCAM05350]|nr:PRC-barrel domain-containing protein [Rhizobium sp. RCAM05350]
MIRTLLATTALAALLTTGALTNGALAQDAATEADPAKAASTTTSQATKQGPAGYFSAAPEQVLASSVLGKTVYTGSDEQGEAIGDVNDVVINVDGGAEALVIGVGGFLGIGEKDVAINFERVSWSDRDGQRIIVVSRRRKSCRQRPNSSARPSWMALLQPCPRIKALEPRPPSSRTRQRKRTRLPSAPRLK